MLLMASLDRGADSKISTLWQAILYSISALAFGSVIALPALLLVGVPLYRALSKWGYVTLPAALGAGALIGAVSGLVIVAVGVTSPGSPTVRLTAYYGTWVGAGFWLGLGNRHRTLWHTGRAEAA